MKEIPILFNGEMVRATLDDHKTQTRRPVKVVPIGEKVCNLPQDRILKIVGQCGRVEKSPFGKPGDVLWVRETFAPMKWVIGSNHYKADNAYFPEHSTPKWTPSIHMPKSACRIKLKVKRVWIERVQDKNKWVWCCEYEVIK